jgi:subtilisin-like proprotein convertase family protein
MNQHKRITKPTRNWLSFLLIAGFLITQISVKGQCLTATYGLYPSTTFTPSCTGAMQNITTAAWPGEYSNVNVTAGTTYTFQSTVSTDLITIGNSTGTISYAFGTGIVTWTATITGVVRFYTHLAGCGSAIASRTRMVSCSAVPPLTGINATASTICSGTTVTLTATGINAAGTVYWYTGGCGTTQVGTGTTLTVTPTATTTYYARQSIGGQFSACVSKTITVNTAPIVNAGPDQTICPGATALAGSYQMQTSTSVAPNSAINDYPATSTSTMAVSGALVNANQIASVTINLLHTFDGDLVISLIAPNGSSIQLANSVGGANDNFTNTVFQVGGAALSGGTAPYTGTFAPAQPFTNLTGSANGTWTLSIYDQASGDVGTIQNWSISYLGMPAVSYAWSSNPAGFSNTTSLTPSVSPTQTTTYTLSVTANGCTITDDVVINANSGATATLTTPSATICNGNSVTLGGNVTATGAWTMTLSDGQIITGTGSMPWTATVTPSATTTYSIVSLTGATCTSFSGTTTLTLPTAGTDLSNDGESATCIVNQNGWVHFYHSSGRLIASVNSQGQNLGSVTMTSYVDVVNQIMPACDYIGNPDYETAVLQRHWVITPTIQPTFPVDVRLPYTNPELVTLSGVSSANANIYDDALVPADLKLSKYSGPLNVNNNAADNCPGAAMGGNGGTTIHNQSNAGGLTSAYSGVSYGLYADYSIPSFSEFWLHASSISSPLPVELVSFTSNCLSTGATQLKWITASENNTDYFEVFASTNGSDWEMIAQEDANGESVNESSYSVVDESKTNKVTYYRLMQVDKNGNATVYPTIISDCINAESADNLIIAPNPTSEIVAIQFNSVSNTLVRIELMDATGKTLQSIEAPGKKGAFDATLNVQNYASGIYYIRSVDSKGAVITVKMSKL